MDYCNLKLGTSGQAYPMTCTDLIFDALHGKSAFSILDAACSFHLLHIAIRIDRRPPFLPIVGCISTYGHLLS